MADSRWDQVERLFHRTRDLHPDERVAILDEVDDPTLRTEVESLLAAHDTLTSLDAAEAAGAADASVGFLQTLDPLRAGTLIGTSDVHPRTLGKYEILRPLGRGGMGMVYLARDPDLDRLVAIKLLPPDAQTDPEADRRLLAEARAGSALDHPNVGTIYGIGEGQLGDPLSGEGTGTTRFIAMAYYEGDTLRERLQSGPIPIDEALDIAEQIASGLAAAHSAGVVHRDIKPENLILSGDTVKIVDFGIARYTSATRTLARGRGTAAYMSPEQTRGEQATPAADVWALGVVVYEMLVGRRPFPGDEPDTVIYSVRNDEPAPLRDQIAADRWTEGSERLAEVVHGCLTKDPAERFPSGAEVLDALRGLESGAGGGSGARRWAWIAAVLVIAAVGAFGADQLGVIGTADTGVPTGARGGSAGALPTDGRTEIVLADFGASEGNAALGRVVTEALRIDLGQSPVLRVVEDHEIMDAFQRMSHDPRDGLSEETAREVALRDGFEAVVTGEAASLGTGFVLAARVRDATSGRTVAAFRESAADSAGLIDALDRLSKKVRGGLGETAGQLSAAAPLPQVATPSLPALERYAMAVDLVLVGGYGPESAALLEEAVALDSTFASAYRALSVALWNMRADRTRTVAATTAAYRLRSRLADRERYVAEAAYHWQVMGDPGRTAAAYRRVLTVAPGDLTAVNNLALALLFQGEPAEAERVIREQGGEFLRPGGPYLVRSNLAAALYFQGDVEGGLAMFDSLVSESAGPAAEVERSRMLAAAGRWDDSEAAARTLLEHSGGIPAVRAAVTRILWHIAATRGRLAEADSLFERLEEYLLEAGAMDELARELVRRSAVTRNLKQDPVGARAQLQEVLRRGDIDVMSTGATVAPRMAAALAAVGDTAEALALADQWEALPIEARSDPDSFSPELARARVEMARAERDLSWADSASARLDRVVRSTIHGIDYLPDLARAYRIAGRRDDAIRTLHEYVEFRHPRRLHRVAPYLGPALRELAILCTEAGDEACAAKARADLEFLWLDADDAVSPVWGPTAPSGP